jgi:hypothetical protein
MLKIPSLRIHCTAAGQFLFKCNKYFHYRKVLKINTHYGALIAQRAQCHGCLNTAGRLKWIFWIFVSTLHGILSLVSRRIISIFLPASHDEYFGHFVEHFTVSYIDIRSCVSLWIVTILRRQSHGRFTANYLDISSGVIWQIISIFCRTSGKTLGYFVVSPAANYLEVLCDASRWINAVFFGRLMVNILDIVGYLKGQLPRRSIGRLPVNYRDSLSGTSP